MSAHTNKILIILLLLAIGTNLLILKDDLVKYAMALTGNYNRTAAENDLTRDAWNLLDQDFLDKQSAAGDTMAGPLTLPGLPTLNNHAATKNYVDNKVRNTSGTAKIFCGRTTTSDWTYPFTLYEMASINVNTSAAGFTAGVPVQYFTSIQGNTQHFYTKGPTSIYTTPATQHNMFTLYIVYEWTEPDFRALQRAQEWGWYINWCGVQQQ